MTTPAPGWRDSTPTATAVRPWAVTLGWGVMGAGTAALLGGGVIVATLAFVAAMGIDRIQRAMSVRDLPTFYQQVAGGLLASLLAVAAVAVGCP